MNYSLTITYSKFILGISVLFVLLDSCAGSDSGNMDITPQDSLVEFEMNEQRLTAVDFNNEISLMQDDLLNAIDYLFMSDSADIEMNLENTLFEIDMNLSELNSMTFDGSEEKLVAAMKDLLSFYQNELNGEFREVVPVLQLSELDEKNMLFLDAYDLRFVELEEAAFLKVSMAQEEFALANNIKLQDL